MRKALAWCALHKMNKIWKSGLTRHIKERLFVLTVESVHLYGPFQPSSQKHWMAAIQGYSEQPLSTPGRTISPIKPFMVIWVSEKIMAQRLKLAGYCVRQKDIIASEFILWNLKGLTPIEVRREPTTYQCSTMIVDSLMLMSWAPQ